MIYNLKNLKSKNEFLKKFRNTIFDAIIIGTGPAAYLLYEKIHNIGNVLIIERGNFNFKNNLVKSSEDSIISDQNYKIKKD